MPSANRQPSLNPTVEDEADTMKDGSTPNPSGPGTESQFSWSELCAQHESVLSSHLVMLDRVKSHVDSDGEAFRVLSSMVDKTSKLVAQFEILKKRIIPRLGKYTTSPEAHHDASDPTSSRHDDSTVRPGDRKKRQRVEKDEMELSGFESQEQTPIPDGDRVQKRKRLDFFIPGGNEDARNALPIALETEDISEEVQRRLAIKDEKRKKRNAKPEKRKRDSLASNGSTSSVGGMTRARKKFKLKK